MLKKLTALTLLLCILLSLTACSSIINRIKPGEKASESQEEVDSEHTVIHTLEDGATTYYCWEDGIVTTKAGYSETSALFWENDMEQGAYVVKNAMGTIFVYRYAEPETEAATEPPTEATTADPYQGHTLEGIVIDSDMKITYYCWDDGTVTTEEAYGPSNLTWTHPWGQKFFNIYNGISDNGNVIYSEKTCTWCDAHKVFYLTYVRDSYDNSKITEYLCHSCHVDLVSRYEKCSSCGYYTYYGYKVDNKVYCEYCYTN